MSSVDLRCEWVGFPLQGAVSAELATSWRGRLNEHQSLLPRRLPREQIVDSPHPVQNAFRVVEALDPDGNVHILRESKPPPDGASAVLNRGLRGERRGWPLDGNWIGTDQGLTTAKRNRRMLAVDSALHELVGRLKEVVAVKLRVKTQNCAPQKSIDDLLAPGADAKSLRIGPGDMPERQDGGIGQPLADHSRQESEVIVVHQNNRVITARLIHYYVGEALVDRHVLIPILLAKRRPHKGDVA